MAASDIKAGMKRKRDDKVQNLPRKFRKNSSDDDESATLETDSALDTAKPANKHTKKERKNNPSSRIHSLKKLLARDTLPSNIRQEKERELASLEYDQAKHKSKKQDKRVLEKYHYVRFVERQKAEKRLKQLRKLMKDEDGETKTELEEDIREMEINRNYAMYAPLHQKYVSIFVKSKGRAEENSKNAQKPSMWFEVETAMQEGQFALEALRDGKRRVVNGAADGEFQNGSSSISQSGKKGKKQNTTKHGSHLADNGVASFAGLPAADDEMSDGGFFQR